VHFKKFQKRGSPKGGGTKPINKPVVKTVEKGWIKSIETQPSNICGVPPSALGEKGGGGEPDGKRLFLVKARRERGSKFHKK